MTEVRDCAQCGVPFELNRGPGQFCSAACQMTWNRSGPRGKLTGDTGLSWSIAAMNDTAQRLGKADGMDLPDALALVSEAVWWVTLADAAIARCHQAAYDHSLLSLVSADRRVTEGTFAGLRFVRNWMGYRADPADFIQPERDPGGGDAPVAAWTWNELPALVVGSLSAKGRNAETVRHRHYCAHLVGKPIGATIACAVTFLNGVGPAS
jgi:hypothetical protein